jgi:hypothetical protein
MEGWRKRVFWTAIVGATACTGQTQLESQTEPSVRLSERAPPRGPETRQLGPPAPAEVLSVRDAGALSTNTASASSAEGAPIPTAPEQSPDSPPRPSSPEAKPAPCTQRVESSLPGVTLRVTSKRCRFSVAEISRYVETPYELRIESPLSEVKPYAFGDEVLVPWPTSSGTVNRRGCGAPRDASNLRVAQWIDGPPGSGYCDCDFGRCTPNTAPPKDVDAGTYKYKFRWIGKTYQGPFDTGEEPGAPFVPGDYELVLRVNGSYLPEGSDTRKPFHVQTTFPMVVTP